MVIYEKSMYLVVYFDLRRLKINIIQMIILIEP